MATILITSGGTKIKIDDVRHISNFSSGEFLSKIAEEALLSGSKVIYLHARGAKKPFENRFVFNPLKPAKRQLTEISEAQKVFLKVNKNIEYVEFQTFDEYEMAVKSILTKRDVDIAFMGAAVSDYGMPPQKGKISSTNDELVIKLTKNSKVIQNVKKWSKSHVFQVGFKLLSGSNKEELIETAYKSGLDNKSDITIANDLQKIRSGNREVYIVTPEKGAIHLAGNDIAKNLVAFVLRRAATQHFKTIAIRDKNFVERYKRELDILGAACNLLYKKNLMTPFYKGSDRSHGSIALKVKEGFLITSRGSNKENLGEGDFVLVKTIDWRKREIKIVSSSDKKASLNAPLVGKIFEVFPKLSAVVHTHSFDTKFPSTPFAETPGTLEYALAPIALLKKSRVVNLKDHGLIAVGEDLVDALDLIMKSKKIEGSCYKEFPELYDFLYERYLKTIPVFVDLVSANTPRSGRIFDMAAGTGEVSIPLIKNGFSVSSMDISKGMLAQLKKKISKKDFSMIKVFAGDIGNLSHVGEYDTVCIRQAINYLAPARFEESFKKIRAVLAPGGKFIFNAPNFNPEIKKYGGTQALYRDRGTTAVIVERNTLKNRVLSHRQKALVIDGDGDSTVVSDTNSFFMYTKNEFEMALKKAGFKSVSFFSSDLKKYDKMSRTLYCVATK